MYENMTNPEFCFTCCSWVKELWSFKLMKPHHYCAHTNHSLMSRQNKKSLPSFSRSTSSIDLISFVKSSVSQTSKHNRGCRSIAQPQTSQARCASVGILYHKLTDTCAARTGKKVSTGMERERNTRMRIGERSSEGKRDGNPKNGTTF